MRKSFKIRALSFLLVVGMIMSFMVIPVSAESTLKGQWKFDGNALDSSGNNANGTLVNASYAAGRNGQALNLSGSNSYVNISNPGVFNNMSSFTISAWVYPRSSNGAIISKVTPNRDFVFQIYNGKLNFHIAVNYDQYCHAYGGTTIPLNKWTQVSVSVESGKITLYVNGIKDGERTSNVTLPQWTGTDMAIGRMSYYSYFNGLLDDVEIYAGGTAKRLIITSVNDGLDRQDMYIFNAEMAKLGYVKYAENTNVSKASLNSYLGNPLATCVYHTGHGNSGIIATSDGYLSYTDVTLQAQNSIIATCLTLTPTQWKSRFGAYAQSILGYTNYSWDYTDNDIARATAQYIGAGYTYARSWYLANAPYSNTRDRWCAYVREASGIVEYSARTGAYPSKANDAVTADKAGKVKVAASLLNDNRTFDKEFAKLAGKSLAVSNKKEDAKFFETKAEFMAKTAATEDASKQIAENWLKANNLFPAGAVFESATPITCQNEKGEYTVVGYIVKYTRDLDGVTVKSTGKADGITVMVNDGKVVSYVSNWSDITTGYAAKAQKVMSVKQVINKSIDAVSRIIKADQITIVDVKPCYGQAANQIVPAFELVEASGSSIIVNAVTGEIIF